MKLDTEVKRKPEAFINIMSFLKRIFVKKENEQPLEPIFPGESFSIFKLNLPEGWGLASANKAYDEYPNKAFYPWHVLIVLEVIDKNENGHPIDLDAIKLNDLEDQVSDFLKKYQTVHFVVRVTRNGFRDLLFYIDQPKFKNEDVRNFCDAVMEERGINFSVHNDPDWKAAGFIK